MRKLQMLLLLLTFTLFTSCNKDDCETGTLVLLSQSNNPYSLYVDGDLLESLPGNSRREITLSTGNHNIRVVQESGFVVFPTEKSEVINIIGCGEVNWQFP